MTSKPLFYMRGAVYRVKFQGDEKPGEQIVKYALCLQEGRILQNRQSFVGVLLTTHKTNDRAHTPAWKVYVSPGESNTNYGVIVDCGQVYTFLIKDVIDHAYNLKDGTMEKVDQALMFGVGILKVEDLKKR